MTAEQKALILKAEKSLEAANLLAEQGFNDFAVSRAYYSMFYVASAFLLGKGLTFSKHSTVIAKFGEYFIKTGEVPVEFHRHLIKAENSRIVGDYDTGQSLTPEHARLQISRGNHFLELAKQKMGPID